MFPQMGFSIFFDTPQFLWRLGLSSCILLFNSLFSSIFLIELLLISKDSIKNMEKQRLSNDKVKKHELELTEEKGKIYEGYH